MLKVVVVMDLPEARDYHVATVSALGHAANATGLDTGVEVVTTDRIDDELLSRVGRPGTAVVIGPGTPYRIPDAAHEVIRTARERGIPLVGT